MRAFIFGTFNPVTNAHINMGMVAQRELGQNTQIIYVPTKDEYIKEWKGYKNGSILKANIRYRLLKQAIAGYKKFYCDCG